MTAVVGLTQKMHIIQWYCPL